MKLGIGLIVIFGANLIFSLFFTFGESFLSHIPAILFSTAMVTWGIYRVRKHNKGKTDNLKEDKKW